MAGRGRPGLVCTEHTQSLVLYGRHSNHGFIFGNVLQGLKIEPFKHPITMDPNYAGTVPLL